ncbi:MAG: glycoside hydrolase family 43 protein [Lachnospiraceae bacterium]|nr:glycoside hydrolase family 43 protein [Lachnospiraceae bacterium]
MKKKQMVLTFLAAAGSALALGGCQKKENLKSSLPVEKTFEEVSVHDPSVVQGEDGSYYIFGSHLAVAKTDDLMNWTYVNQGVKNSNTVIPDVLTAMKEAFDWSHSNTFWAPDVVQLEDGSYKLYYCNCEGSSPLSCLGTAVSDSIAGPYTNEGLMLKSGMDASEADEDGNLYQATTDPNVVDPNTFYDKDGRLWMVYGSYSGGIFIKEMDPGTGDPLESGYGKKLLGGNHLRIEGPYIIYNPDTDYYYLFLSFGGLDSDGGYNIRVCRSKTPDGPYEDSLGNEMTDCKGPSGTTFSDATAEQYGTKLMGNYKFLWQEGEEGENRKGYLSSGHNSCLYQEDTGKYFIIYHTRFESMGEEHQVRVHQMFFNEEGWPVIAPYRYTEESLEKVEKSDVATTYKLINHGRAISAEINESQNIQLKSGGQVTGAVDGTWELKGDNEISLTIEGDTYDGYFLKQWDEDGLKNVMTFTALCEETGVAVWGSGVYAVE